MTAWLAANMAPVMFSALVLFLLIGYPVAFSLAAVGMLFGWIGIELGMLTPALLQAQLDVLLVVQFGQVQRHVDEVPERGAMQSVHEPDAEGVFAHRVGRHERGRGQRLGQHTGLPQETGQKACSMQFAYARIVSIFTKVEKVRTDSLCPGC